MAKIIVTGNDQQRREFELGAINTIGRHPDNTLQILDRIVSKDGFASSPSALYIPGRLTPLRRARSEMPRERATVPSALRNHGQLEIDEMIS